MIYEVMQADLQRKLELVVQTGLLLTQELRPANNRADRKRMLAFSCVALSLERSSTT